MITKLILRFVSNGTLIEMAKNSALASLVADECYRRLTPEHKARLHREARDRGRQVTASLIESVGYAEVLQRLCATISRARKDYVVPHFYTGAKEALQEHRERTPLT